MLNAANWTARLNELATEANVPGAALGIWFSEAAVTAMQSACAAIPEFSAPGSAIGLGWRLSRWGNRTIVGHDGDTIGQSAYPRIDPEAGIAACRLTNSAK